MENRGRRRDAGRDAERSTRRWGAPIGIQVFAGPRDDPFFIDLEAAFCILPDRRPVSGPARRLLRSHAATPSAPFFFRESRP